MPAFVERLIDRVMRLPIAKLVLSIFDRYNGAGGGLLANGLAFATLFAAVPTVLLALGLTGFLIDDPTYQARLLEVLSDAFPPLEPLFDELLNAVTSGSGITSLVGVLGLIWAISQFYATLDFAMARLFPGVVERDIVRRTLRGIRRGRHPARRRPGLDPPRLGDVGAGHAHPRGVPEGVGDPRHPDVAAGVPRRSRSPSWRSPIGCCRPGDRPSVDVAVPAIVAGIAVSLLTQVFTFLAPRLVGATAFVGSLAAAFVALAWLSFSFQAILLGAAWVAIRMSSRTVSLPLTVESETASAAPPAAVESTPDDVREDADLQR